MNPIYTAEEVLEAFEAHQDKLGDGLDEIFYDGPSTWKFKEDEQGRMVLKENAANSWDYEKIDVPFLLRGVPTEVSIAEQTGGMDEGSNASITFQIGSQYFRKDGYYASHYGYDWDGAFYEVRPKQVTITQFERI
ncbi:hypothetical protein [Brevibacterium sp. CFH 10365]|uniref:hypothetical protein n=1 Tax=Brevibacterium sp. CFH 10365 TaxID=2585207 RepID=UPI001266273D|nr:hypothetical protein [Brevibacterium sp. CFH 10365]